MSNSQPILITGATGQVGAAIAAVLPGPTLTPTRAELDLASPDSIRAYIQRTKPSWIINPAAYTAVDKAQSEPELAHAINAEAPRILGEEAQELGIPILHFSTDYVFPGTGTQPYKEDDATGPLSVYGATKLAGEQALAATGAAHIILRTSWVYAATGKNFVHTILRLAREREELKIVADQFGAPTSANDLANVTQQIILALESNAANSGHTLVEAVQSLGGVYHVTGAGETSWYGFAREIIRLRSEAEPHTRFASILPIATSDFPTPASRPANSRLDCHKLVRAFALHPTPWEQSLAAVLAEIPVQLP